MLDRRSEGGPHLWVIDTALNGGVAEEARWRRDGAAVVELNPGLAVCLGRANRERPDHVPELIRAWYRHRGLSA